MVSAREGKSGARRAASDFCRGRGASLFMQTRVKLLYVVTKYHCKVYDVMWHSHLCRPELFTLSSIVAYYVALFSSIFNDLWQHNPCDTNQKNILGWRVWERAKWMHQVWEFTYSWTLRNHLLCSVGAYRSEMATVRTLASCLIQRMANSTVSPSLHQDIGIDFCPVGKVGKVPSTSQPPPPPLPAVT